MQLDLPVRNTTSQKNKVQKLSLGLYLFKRYTLLYPKAALVP